MAGGLRSQSSQNLVHERGDVVPALVRTQCAAFDARQIQQISDDAIQPLRLVHDRVREIMALLGRPHHVVLQQAAGRRHDRRQRRAQIVRDSVQERPSQLVGASQNLGLVRLSAQARALDGQAQLSRHSRQQPIGGFVELSGAPARRQAAARPTRRSSARTGTRCTRSRSVVRASFAARRGWHQSYPATRQSPTVRTTLSRVQNMRGGERSRLERLQGIVVTGCDANDSAVRL